MKKFAGIVDDATRRAHVFLNDKEMVALCDEVTVPLILSFHCQMGLPSVRPLVFVLHETPIHLLHFAMIHFHSELPKRQPSLITTEFYFNQIKDLLEAVAACKVGSAAEGLC
jgi:hypothetical protein